MIKDITIGQYYPVDSVIHRLDPRTKIKGVLLFVIFLFVVVNPFGYLVAGIFIASVIALSKIPVGYVLRGLKPVAAILLITIFFNMIWTPGNILYQFWIFKITDSGLKMALNMGVRLILLICGTSMMTLTTSAIGLTDGMEILIAKVPLINRVSHEIAMILSIALRFIPTLMEETDRIMKAQKSRGADFESGNLINRAKALIPILVPLFVSAFQRAEELAMAMESRCYQGGSNRTRMKELIYTKADTIAGFILTFVMGAMVLTRFIPVGFF